MARFIDCKSLTGDVTITVAVSAISTITVTRQGRVIDNPSYRGQSRYGVVITTVTDQRYLYFIGDTLDEADKKKATLIASLSVV